MTRWDVFGAQNWVEVVSPGEAGTVNALSTTRRLRINSAALLALTITFPDNPIDFQPFRVYSKNSIDALTLVAGAGGGTIDDPIPAVSTDGHFEYTYHSLDGVWYRTL